MVFADNHAQNETYTFKEMLRQDDFWQFIDVMMVEVNSHEDMEN